MNDSAVLVATTRLAEQLGLGSPTPRVIGRFSNLVVDLPGTPWVLRVATGTAQARDTAGHARRELALCRQLSARGAAVPTPAPTGLAGPHRSGGWDMTLWPRLDLAPGDATPEAAGRALAQAHRALASASLPDAPPPWAPLDEAARLLAHPRVVAAAAPADRLWVAERLSRCAASLRARAAPLQWLHGDAHLNNVRALAAPAPGGHGVLWLDWEDACTGPLEWDLACLVAAGRVLGTQRAWSEAALQAWRAHGPAIDEDLLDACIEARTLFVCAWTWWLGADDPQRAARLAGRLEWMRAKNSGLSYNGGLH